MQEGAVMRERMAVLSNDIEALDRTLETLGYAGEVKLTARLPRVVLFYRGELRQFLAGRLREAGPQTSRQLAEALVTVEGKDARDRRMMNDIVRRIGKALRQMQDARIVSRTAEKVRGEFVWSESALSYGATAGRTSQPIAWLAPTRSSCVEGSEITDQSATQARLNDATGNDG